MAIKNLSKVISKIISNSFFQKKFHISFFIGILALAFNLDAIENQYYYWNGKNKIYLQPINDYIIEFSNGESTTTSVINSHSSKIKNVRKIPGGHQIIQLFPNDYATLVKTKSISSRYSPLFKEGGMTKALVGGILITFKLGSSEEVISKFCLSLGLTRKKKISLPGQQQIWIVNSPPGLESLELSNNIAEGQHEIVESVRPNFWQEISHRGLNKAKVNKKIGK